VTERGRAQPTAWSPGQAASLENLFSNLDTPEEEFAQALSAAELEFGEDLCGELIYQLVHLRFEPGEAREHWDLLLAHRREMEEALSKRVDLRVALVSYFVEVAQKLENPTVIEMKLLEQTRALAYRDELTGLRNFRFFRDFLDRELIRGDRFGEPVSLIMTDVDDFKVYNDRFGHEVGNRALATIGEILGDTVRGLDLAARFGGEEFVLVIPSTPKLGAREVAERARKLIEDGFTGSDEGEGLTVSMGVATYPADAADDEELIRSADRALYLAKSQGKNQVQLYDRSQRSYRRFTLELAGWHSMPAGADHALQTVNVSTGGLKFRTDVELAIGSLVDVRLEVPNPRRTIDLVGRAVQCEQAESGWQVAIQLIDMNTRDRRLLGALLHEQQE